VALRGTLTHRKTRRLAKALGIPVPCALGVLEALWHVTAEQQPDGGIGRMSNQDIADEMFYDGDADELILTLESSGWIDAREDCGYCVHDWHEHADSYVHAFLAKRTLLFVTGQFPDIPHSAFNADTRKRIASEFAQKYPDVPQDSPGQVPDKSEPVPSIPEPVPVPEPIIKKPTVSISCADWAEFLAVYPKRKGDLCKAKGEEKFKSLLKSGQSPGEIIAGAKRYSDFLRATDKYATEFVKQIPTFLNGRAWEESWDVPSPPGLLSKIEQLNAQREARGA